MTADDIDRLCERLDEYAVLCVHLAGEAHDPLDAAGYHGRAHAAHVAMSWLRGYQ